MDNSNFVTVLIGVIAAVIGIFIGSKFLGQKTVTVTEPIAKPVAPEIKEKTAIIERIIEEEKKKVNSNADQFQKELNQVKDIKDEKERLEKLAELVNKISS